jgi:hypothetical protein
VVVEVEDKEKVVATTALVMGLVDVVIMAPPLEPSQCNNCARRPVTRSFDAGKGSIATTPARRSW